MSQNFSISDTLFKISKTSQSIIKSRKRQNSTIVTYVNYLKIKRQKLSTKSFEKATQFTSFSSLEILQHESSFTFDSEDVKQISNCVTIDDFDSENKEQILQKVMSKIDTKQQKKYRILMCSDNIYVTDFTIRYLHSSSRFEIISTKTFLRIFVLFSSFKSTNALSNTTMTRIAVEIAIDSMKFKK